MFCYVLYAQTHPFLAVLSVVSYNMCFGLQSDYSWIMANSYVAEICDYLVSLGLKTVLPLYNYQGLTVLFMCFPCRNNLKRGV